ncbi:class I SAM-dependent methyltransferase [Colwellia sp. BRX10-3]|nr:class I SAM-dependent methyltransferase [Colwellia sp. BRX10-3]
MKYPNQCIKSDGKNYLTCKSWVEKLEGARDEIVTRWGEMLYRRLRLYLWGSAQAFLSHEMDAYRVVLEFPNDSVSSSDESS